MNARLIIPLASMFASKYSEQNGIPEKRLSPAATEKLRAHHWQGNIRELENTMHRAVLVSVDTEIEASSIMLAGQKAATIAQTAAATAKAAEKTISGGEAQHAALVGRTVADVERELILNTLDHCLGNRTHAANILGISIRTLRNKLKEYGDAGVAISESGR